MNDPLLNGPPAFALLAIMLALSAYLRSISDARSTLIDNIEYEVEPFVRWFPLGAAHTKKKLKYLRSSKRILTWVSHPIIGVTAVITWRILMVTYARWKYPVDSEHFSTTFRVMDFFLLLVVFILICALWVVHTRGRRYDKSIRKKMRRWKKAQADLGQRTDRTE